MHYPNKKASFIFSLATIISVAAVAAGTVGLVSRHHKLGHKAWPDQSIANDLEGPSIIEDLVAHNAQGF